MGQAQRGEKIVPSQSYDSNLGLNHETRKIAIFYDIELLIANRKGTRSCTKHPLSNFISYKHLSSSFHALISGLESVSIPNNVQEALRIHEWKKAIFEEMRTIKEELYV